MDQIKKFVFKIPKIYRYAAIAGFCLLLLIGFYFLFINEFVGQIDQLKTEIEDLKRNISNEQKIAQERPKLLNEIKGLEAALSAMVASLPEKQEIDILLKRITDLLSETNLVNKRFVPGQEIKDEELYYAKIPIQMNIRGSYEKQGIFFANLNGLPRIVNVPTVKIGKAGSLSGRESELASRLEFVALDSEITGETFRRLSQEEIKEITERKQQGPGKSGPPPARGGK